MPGFLVGHATHPDWRAALALAGAQIESRQPAHEQSGAGPLTLGFAYFTDHFAPHAQALLAELRQRWPGVAWVGSVGVGVCAGGVEYIDEPALALSPGADGLAALRCIVAGAPGHLAPGGWLLLEHGWDQAPAVAALLAAAGFGPVETRVDLAGRPRCTGARWSGR